MRKVGVIVDSTFGISTEYAKDHDISIARLKVIIADQEYEDGLLDPNTVVQAFHNKETITTSQPTPEQFIEVMNKQLKTYDSVICLTISKTLSGTINSASLAATIIDNPNIHVIDSETTINGGAYLTEELVKYLDEGHDAKAGLAYLEELKAKGSLIFTVNDLSTLHKNGRLGRISAVIGKILRVRPI